MSRARFEVVLAGGDVFDGTPGSWRRADMGISRGVIQAIEPDLSHQAATVIDCRGKVVTPGLIDLHVHAYEGATSIGLNPVDAAYTRGVVACSDAGSAGASSFSGFKSYIVDTSPIRVFSFLNVSVLGLVDIRHGELKDRDAFREGESQEVIEANRDVIRGLKLRLSENVVGQNAHEMLERSIALADNVRLPLMVHIGNTTCGLDEIVSKLRPGDLITHVYTGFRNGILDENGRLLPEVIDARSRGVLFEVGHGRTQLDYGVARTALDQGFPPDIISTDISRGNWQGPSFDLATVGSKLIALGMPEDDVLAAMTSRPAEVLCIVGEGYGYLRVGDPAHATVLERRSQIDRVPDAAGEGMEVARLEPELTVNGAMIERTAPWRGYAALATA